MITLSINHREVTVPRGNTLLEAAEKAGVFIPTLCHDKRVAPYGACRLCVVEDRKRPGSLIPSCFTPARNGMDVITDSAVVLEAVRTQLKLLLVNHPLDCPVCDKAGECTLQDLVIRYGVTEAPFTVDRVPRLVDRTSPLIERDMNRCILCGLCVRICGELQGRGEVDFIHRGYRTQVGTDGGRALDCDFCGLCVSACPVGALGDRLFGNRTRVWKLERKMTVCSFCGLGCPVEFHLEKGRIRRAAPEKGKDGGKGLLCVRGRFGWRAFDHPARPARPRIRRGGLQVETTWSDAVDFTASALQGFLQAHGGESLALLTADHLTTEEARACWTLFRDTLRCGNIASLQAGGYRRILSILNGEGKPGRPAGTMQDLEEADVLLVLGGGAAERHPVLKPLVNRFLKSSWKELAVLSSWPDYFTERATLSLTVPPERFDGFLAGLREALSAERTGPPVDIDPFSVDTARLARLIGLLESDREITVLVVPDLFGENGEKARMAAFLRDRARAVIPLGGQVNSPGAVLDAGLTSTGPASEGRALLEAIEDGRIRGLWLLGEDPLETLPGGNRVQAALEKLELVICQGPFETAVTGQAHAVLPSALPAEKAGSVRSLFGVENVLRPVLSPFGEVRPDGEILRDIDAALAGVRSCPLEFPGWNAVEGVAGLPDACGAPAPCRTEKPGGNLPAGEGFPCTLVPVPSIFGDGPLSLRSPDLLDLRSGLRAEMNPEDFEECRFEEPERVTVRTPFGSAPAKAGQARGIARGTILLRHVSGSPQGLSLIGPGTTAVPAFIERRRP